MPASVIGEVLGSALRFVGEIVLKLVFEIFIQGSGYLILRVISPKKEPSDTASALMGLLFWMIIGVVIFMVLQKSKG